MSMCGPSTFSKREWTLLILLSGVILGCSLCASLQAPFYPQEAEKKGASPTEYGFVFGIFELTSFVAAPLYGKYMGRLGAACVLKGGAMLAGASLITFGLLDYVQGHELYVGLSFLVRVIEACGTAAAVTATLSIIVVTFPENFVQVFTTAEVFQGLGFMIGPTIGGYLFQIGGFLCPFVAVGSLVFTNGLLICAILPKIEDKEDKMKPRVSIVGMMKIVPVFLDVLATVVEAIKLGFLLAVLEPHIRQFGLSPLALGGMFIISGVMFTLVSPLVGVLCDKHMHPKKVILLGCILSIVSYLFIGPVPFTPFQKTIWLVGIGLVLDGIGTALVFIPSFVDAIRCSVKYGLPYDINTYALVSGLYASSFSLGAFIGPCFAGVLYDTVGFRRGMLFVIALHLVLMALITWFLCVEKRYDELHIVIATSTSSEEAGARGEAEDESTPLVMEVGDAKETQPLSLRKKHKKHVTYKTVLVSDSKI